MSKFLIIINVFFIFQCSSPKEIKSVSNDKPQVNLRSVKSEMHNPTRWDVGDTTVSNEDRLDLLIPHLKGVKGAYIGVGSEQNLTLAAWADSEFIYLMDFTKIVVDSNKISILFLKEAETPEQFIFFWSKKGRESAKKLLQEKLPEEKDLPKLYDKVSSFIQRRHSTNLKLSKIYNYPMFMTDQNLYSHIRKLAVEDKIFPVQGNLLGKETFYEIGTVLKKNNLNLGILYMSNAEEYFKYNDHFRNSINNLPSDPSSVVIRTISVRRDLFPWSPGSDYSTQIGFHYAVQKLDNFKKWMGLNRSNLSSLNILMEGGDTDKTHGLTIVKKDP